MVAGSVVKDQYEGRGRLVFDIEATLQETVRFSDDFHGLLGECNESIMCVRSSFSSTGLGVTSPRSRWRDRQSPPSRPR